MTTQIASELLAKCRLLTLAGQDEEGDIQWIGKTEHWDKLHLENESILRDAEIDPKISTEKPIDVSHVVITDYVEPKEDDMDDTSGDRDIRDHFNSSNGLPDWAGGMDL